MEKVGELKTSLRKNLWDEENRLMAVNLKPDDSSNHPIAIYTYSGTDRVVRYNMDRMDIFSNGKKVGENVKDNIMIYPSGLLMGKAQHSFDGERVDILSYTKHYYIGSERISAKTGTCKNLGVYPGGFLPATLPNLNDSEIRLLSTNKVSEAGTVLAGIYTKFGLTPPVLDPVIEGDITKFYHDKEKLNIFYFHPDHLGSSSYITNAAGTVSQHMEYLPFGETLVDEHTNSFSSPFKFNGKEKDEETGNYFYGARYYDPKWSIFISVDPLAEQTMDAYGYCYQNPVNLVDPTGMSAEDAGDIDPPVKKKNSTFTVNIDVEKYSQPQGAYVGQSLDILVTEGIRWLGETISGSDVSTETSENIQLVTTLAIVIVSKGKNTKADAELGEQLTKAADTGKSAKQLLKEGRSGKQERLAAIANDSKASKADKGWVKQEQNQITRGKRNNIRNPPGRDLAHKRGKEAAKGYSYEHSNLQNRADHRSQHKYDNNGRKNKENPN